MRIDPVRRLLDAAGIRYALIGGHALAARGYPRFTIDIALLTTDIAALDAALWRPLEEAGIDVERRRGDSSDPLAGVVHVLLEDDTDVDIRDAGALLATDREHLVSIVESRLLAAAVGPDATACWRQVLALPA